MKIPITSQLGHAFYQRKTGPTVDIVRFRILHYILEQYNDDRETENRSFGFAIRQIRLPDLEDKYDIKNEFSNGTKYEEARSQELEVLSWLRGKTKENDPFDWSFDPLTLIQGKQWKT